MPLYVISIIVFSGAVIGRILGVRIRMRENPELREKGFKAFFSKRQRKDRAKIALLFEPYGRELTRSERASLIRHCRSNTGCFTEYAHQHQLASA